MTLDGFTILGSPTFHYADESVIRCWDDNLTFSNNILDGYFGVLCKGQDYVTIRSSRLTVNKGGITCQPNAGTHIVIAGNTIARARPRRRMPRGST